MSASTRTARPAPTSRGAETHPFLRNRCYSDDPSEVADLARAVADGLVAGGVLPVLKHIPGHGAARVDSHEGLPVVESPRSRSMTSRRSQHFPTCRWR